MSVMRFLHRLIRNFVIPNNAGSSSPRLVLGPDVPPELTTFYSVNRSLPVVAAILSYTNATDYYYDAALGNASGGDHARGVVKGGVVAEYEYSFAQATPGIIGETLGDPSQLTLFIGNTSRAASGNEFIDIRQSQTLIIETGAGLQIDGHADSRGWLYGANITTGNMTAAVSAETNVPSAAINVNVQNGHAYMMHLACRASLSDMTQAYEIRVRRDTALTGTQVGVYQITNNGTAAAGVFPISLSLPWLSAATENLKLFFSVIRTSAAGTIQLLGSPGAGIERAWVGFEDVGLTLAFSGATGVWTTA